MSIIPGAKKEKIVKLEFTKMNATGNDFIVIDNLKDFSILQTYINGVLVAENGNDLIATTPESIVNNFNIEEKEPTDFKIQLKHTKIKVIEVIDGQLLTKTYIGEVDLDAEGNAVSNIEADILKIAVVNRYYNAPVAVAFIKNFGLKKGAIASSVAHDSHNIIVVGVDDESICKAVNLVIKEQGGVSAVSNTSSLVLGLPVAGLMSNEDGYKVADD